MSRLRFAKHPSITKGPEKYPLATQKAVMVSGSQGCGPYDHEILWCIRDLVHP